VSTPRTGSRPGEDRAGVGGDPHPQRRRQAVAGRVDRADRLLRVQRAPGRAARVVERHEQPVTPGVAVEHRVAVTVEHPGDDGEHLVDERAEIAVVDAAEALQVAEQQGPDGTALHGGEPTGADGDPARGRALDADHHGAGVGEPVPDPDVVGGARRVVRGLPVPDGQRPRLRGEAARPVARLPHGDLRRVAEQCVVAVVAAVAGDQHRSGGIEAAVEPASTASSSVARPVAPARASASARR